MESIAQIRQPKPLHLYVLLAMNVTLTQPPPQNKPQQPQKQENARLAHIVMQVRLNQVSVLQEAMEILQVQQFKTL
jgi:hypothetical protein